MKSFRHLSTTTAVSLASLLIIAIAIPFGISLNNSTQNLTPKADVSKTFCATDVECGCALDVDSNTCAVQNTTYLTGQCTIPDFCSGISGNLTPTCVNNQCMLIDPNLPTPTPTPTGMALCSDLPTCGQNQEFVVAIDQDHQCLNVICSSFNSVYCSASSSAILKSGEAPYAIRLDPYAANAGGTDSIIGYQWDFDGDGSWDDDRFTDHGWVDHEYTQAGTYQPKYRVRGRVGYSQTCDHPFKITVTSPSNPTYDVDIDDNGTINIVDYTNFILEFIRKLNL